jgi:feruloyl esterase
MEFPMSSSNVFTSTIRTAAFALLAGAAFASPVAAATCESLTSQALPATTITTAQAVSAGAFTQPGGGRGGAAFASLPAFCRVAATLKPTSDSDIKIEVWMPASGWNGKFLAVGNGGWTGSIAYPALAEGLARGYATASTDTGHEGGSASFGLGHPEKVIDFAHRAVHEMTAKAKVLVDAFYGSAPRYSYWNGCSAGGRQGMKAAQMYPADFNGIIAGSPGLDWSARSAQATRVAQALQPEASRLTPAFKETLHAAVVAACDAKDGVKDGLIENPLACTFDPATLACPANGGAACLTPAQVTTAKLMYSSFTDTKNKREIPGLALGSELAWTEFGWSAPARTTGVDHFKFLVFENPAWDLPQFNAAADVPRLTDGVSGQIDARDTNLKPFFDRGGRLLQYHGWADPQITPLASTSYFMRVAATMGGPAKAHASYRLFMAPGMGHCGGGEGPNDFDELTALEQWVEKGVAPARLDASHATGGKVDRTRPLCPFPQVATFTGKGSTDDAANFVCK